MKKPVVYNLFILLCVSSLCGLRAQEAKVNEASKNFEQYAFADARSLYRNVAEKGFVSPDVLKKLGDSFYFTGEYPEAAEWYGKLMANVETTEIEPEYYFRYAQSLKSIQRYDLSDIQMEKFYDLKGDDKRGKLFQSERDYLKEIEAQSGRYEVEQVDFNSGLQDFAPSFYGDQLVFSSNRESRTGDYIHSWNDQPFLDLYIVENPSEKGAQVKRFSSEVNTPYHESSCTFSENGDVVYFTRNNYSKQTKLQRDADGTAKLKLYRSFRKSGGWTKAEELPFNSDEYSTAHPVLSPDGSKLYFASDRPGTKGLSDLWMVDVYISGDFGEPINLGDKINTEGRETFPFISADNKLFYATDGHVGLGGLDVFVTQLNEEGKVGESFNVGKPVNSAADDFGLIINSQTGKGYFASNRLTGMGNDDIYAIIRNQKILTNCAQNITGVTKDTKTDEIIAGATVELRDMSNVVVASVLSDEAGRYNFTDVACNTPFVVRARKDTYDPSEALLNTSSDLGGVISRDLFLKAPLKIELGEDLAKTLDLSPIYFDLDKHAIRSDAAIELEKVIAFMKLYPRVKIDVRSHTDSRAPDAYNMTLSQRRNLSTLRYIVNQGGIDSSRITGRGYGETQLTNACGNGIECSEEEHQLNRRSEFIIMTN